MVVMAHVTMVSPSYDGGAVGVTIFLLLSLSCPLWRPSSPQFPKRTESKSFARLISDKEQRNSGTTCGEEASIGKQIREKALFVKCSGTGSGMILTSCRH